MTSKIDRGNEVVDARYECPACNAVTTKPEEWPIDCRGFNAVDYVPESLRSRVDSLASTFSGIAGVRLGGLLGRPDGDVGEGRTTDTGSRSHTRMAPPVPLEECE